MDAPMSRRSLLLATSIAMVVGNVRLLAPSPAVASTVSPVPIASAEPPLADGVVTATCYSAEWAEETKVAFPSVIPVPIGSAGGDVSLSVTWDVRLFDVREDVLVVRGEVVDMVRAHRSDGVLTVTLPQGSGSVLLQVQSIDLYPKENIGVPMGSKAVFSGGASQEILYAVETRAAAPWGVELQVAWEEENGVARAAVVSALSVGPNPAPAGTEIVVSTDDAVAILEDDGLEDLQRIGSDVDGGRREYRYSLLADVDAGQTASIRLGGTTDTTSDLSGIDLSRLGLVTVLIPDRARADARNTRRYTAAPITSTGTHLQQNGEG